MEILDLYKLHINPSPDGVEIHNLFMRFDLGVFVNYPDCPPFSEMHWEIKRNRLVKENMCKDWIILNSKL